MKTPRKIFNDKYGESFSNLTGALTESFIECCQNISEEYTEQFKPKWIPVSERLPELTFNDGKASEEVIVLIDSDTYIGYYTIDGWCYAFGDLMENPFFKKLTHWSPIPEKP